MPRSLVLPVLLASCSCSSEPPARAPLAAPTATPAPAPAVTTMQGAVPGVDITLRGRPSKIIWQHLTTSVPGKRLEYFDLGGGEEQTVVYWANPPTCAGDVEVTGKVIEVRGSTKRPGTRETKVDDSYTEVHVDVRSARCASPAGATVP